MKAARNLVATVTVNRPNSMSRRELRSLGWWLIKQGLWLRKQKPESLTATRLTLRLTKEVPVPVRPVERLARKDANA